MNSSSFASRDRLIVALDFATAGAALDHVDRLEGRCRWFKVGLELYLAAGAGIVHTLRNRGFNVFLDLKLHDIPNTVAGAVRSVSSLGASLFTLHAAGGSAMLEAASEAATIASQAPTLLAVTVLTSMNAAQLSSIGIAGSPSDQVLRLARLAWAAGIPGMVCSPEEVGRLRAEMVGNNIASAPLLVAPGIRLAGAAAEDQSRIATPFRAIRNGASMLVVGRPITRAADPLAAFENMLSEMDAAVGNLVPA